MLKELTSIQYRILVALDFGPEICQGYDWMEVFPGEEKAFRKECKNLRELDYVEYYKGLMSIDDGGVAGSGFCINEEKEGEVKRLLTEYEEGQKQLGDVILPRGIEVFRSVFGGGEGMLEFKTPKDCDLIILMGNRGGGYIPYRCLLPHQVYVQDIKKAFKEEKFEVIYVVPISSKSPFQIAYNKEYGKQRWGNK